MWLWFKRVAPFALILLLWLGYTGYGRRQSQQREYVDRIHALTTAQVWVATARFRNSPDAFIAFRDSVLAASGLSAEQMFKYLQLYREHPEQYRAFSVAVSFYVDSLCQMQDSGRGGEEVSGTDSAASP